MNYSISRKVIDNVVQATLIINSFDFQEAEAISRFGAPTIDKGGVITGAYTRSSQTSPVLTVVGDGTGATVSASINDETGVIEGVVVTDGGANYTTASIAISGNSIGSGATFTVEITASPGPITGVTVTDGGALYVPTPIDISFELSSSIVTLAKGLIIRENFSFTTSRNADLMAHAYTTQIEAAFQTAIDTLLAKKAEYIAETQNDI